nr:thyroid adenoma-associated protein homolog [Ciona intestinalis]|eukprot:XP_018667018.1 thyroid adenoma-associated protein homolog [Ciona intestinalis]
MFILCLPKHNCKLRFCGVLTTPMVSNADVFNSMDLFLSSLFKDANHTIYGISKNEIVQTFQMCISKSLLRPVTLDNFQLSFKGVGFLVDVIKDCPNCLNDSVLFQVNDAVLFQLTYALKCANELFHILSSKKKDLQHEEYAAFYNDAWLQLFTITESVLQNGSLKGDAWSCAGSLMATLLVHNTTKFQCMFDQVVDGKLVFCPNELCDEASCTVFKGLLVLLGKSSHAFSTLTDNTVVHFMILAKNFITQVSSRTVDVTGYLSLSKCVVEWMITLSKLCEEENSCISVLVEESVDWVLELVSMLLSLFVDSLKHQAKSILSNYLHAVHFLKEDTILTKITQTVFKWNWNERSVYICLTCILTVLPVDIFINLHPNSPAKLLQAIGDQTIATYASHLYCNLSALSWVNRNANKTDELISWFNPILELMLDPDYPHSKQAYDYFLLKLLKIYGADAVEYVVSMMVTGSQDKSNLLYVYAICLQGAQKYGFLKQIMLNDKHSIWKFKVEVSVFQAMLTHHSDKLRLEGFSFLCESWRFTKLNEAEQMELIKYSLPYNLSSHCSSFRQQLLRYLIKFLQRFVTNYQKAAKSGEDAMMERCLKFLDWLLELLFSQLFIGCSYPRRNFTLKLLHQLVLNTFEYRDLFQRLLESFTFCNIETLVDFLKDPFEENQQLSLDVLTNQSVKHHIHYQMNDMLSELSETSLLNCRKSFKSEVSKNASFVLRLVALLSDDVNAQILRLCNILLSFLEEDVNLIKNQLYSITTTPVYGNIFAVRMLLNEVDTKNKNNYKSWRTLVCKCIDLCVQVTSAVQPVVNNDSPEGFLPQPNVADDNFDLNQNTSPCGVVDNHVEAQLVLVASWRSAKESLLLLQHIACNFPLDSSSSVKDAVLSWHQVRKTQMLNLC